MLQRTIPSTGQLLPAIGLGTWSTFDVVEDAAMTPLTSVLQTLHTAGGRVIDSSPMYGRAEKVIGSLTSLFTGQEDFFYATKVWTNGKKEGVQQMEESMRRMKRTTVDLMQIHNLVDWQVHLKTLEEWKAQGKIKYIGITHYLDSAHDQLEQIITDYKIDFVQFNYSILSRHAAERLLPSAADQGVATLINRPFGQGSLFSHVAGKSLPAWATDYEINNWSQFFLKFLLSHPAVTCVIPATANPEHAAANVQAGTGPLPDEAARNKMVALIKTL